MDLSSSDKEGILASQSTANETAQPTYLEILAYLGATRHYGAWNATNELSVLCHIEKGKYILDVGCGTGKTSSAFAKRRGCRVVGVDLSPHMIEWARETAQRESVLGQVEFRTADAQQLPFDDATFDAVICESVLAFVPDKAKTLCEFIRVCKPGGYIGMNETTWLTAPVPAEIEASMEAADFSNQKLLTLDEWRALLNASGLKDLVMKTYRTSARADTIDRIRWFGIRGMLRNIANMRAFAKSSPANRAALDRYLSLSRRMPKNFYDYFGYGIYVGIK
jgi:ubiquinone/menaquinone biosynthesis C-methylase UbiE